MVWVARSVPYSGLLFLDVGYEGGFGEGGYFGQGCSHPCGLDAGPSGMTGKALGYGFGLPETCLIRAYFSWMLGMRGIG